MLYSELSDAQKETVRQGDLFIRRWLRQMAGQDLDLKLQWYNDNMAPILALLDAGQVIPDSSNLAGAQDLTKEQVTALKNWIAGISADIETNKSLLVKAIGVDVQ